MKWRSCFFFVNVKLKWPLMTVSVTDTLLHSATWRLFSLLFVF